jgi:hypothetical protein
MSIARSVAEVLSGHVTLVSVVRMRCPTGIAAKLPGNQWSPLGVYKQYEVILISSQEAIFGG